MAPADWMQAAQTGQLNSITEIISAILTKTQHLSVPEVPDAGKHHGHPKPVGSPDYLGVADRPSRLNHCRGACLGYGLQTVGEWEKGVGGRNGALERKNGFHRAEPCGVDPAHLPGADPDRLAMAFAEAGVDDRV